MKQREYIFEYQEVFTGQVIVKAKNRKQASGKARKALENGDGDIISSDLQFNHCN